MEIIKLLKNVLNAFNTLPNQPNVGINGESSYELATLIESAIQSLEETVDLTTYQIEDIITSRLEEMGIQLPKKYSYFAPDGAWGIGVSHGEVYANNEEEAREKANEQVKADCEELNDKLGGHYLEWAGGTRNIEIEEIK